MRHEAALLVGFKNYAEYSLATKMAGEVSEVLGFLTELADRTRAGAQKELDSIQEIVDTPLEAWDVAYYLEKLKQKKFSISDNELREYFPATVAQAGLFTRGPDAGRLRLSRLPRGIARIRGIPYRARSLATMEP